MIGPVKSLRFADRQNRLDNQSVGPALLPASCAAGGISDAAFDCAEVTAMRLIRSASFGIVCCGSSVIVASLIFAAAGEAQAPVKVHPATATSESTKPARATPERIRELQKALLETGNDPGPIDGILGPRTKAALRRYSSVPPPQVPTPAQQIIAQFGRANDRGQSP